MLKMAYQSDIGRVRQVNEDRAIVQEDLNGLTLAIVADGMGGHQAGDIASQMAVELIQQQLQSMNRGTPLDQRQRELKAAIEAANEKIFEFASGRENYHGMGTTVVAVVSDENTAVIAHIGDSRAYRIHGDRIEQLTEDHSLVNELVKSGQITPEEADHHPRRNVLTRALGTEPSIEVDVREMVWEPGDLLLLCSDGLSALLTRDQLLALANAEGELDDKVKRLVTGALDAGGDDNITVVLMAHAAGGVLHHDEEAR
ncbi:Stp1/IreP family PP2C-type Ser/Thr phosphatase [Paenibacillus filicis]|uniref:Stp1/IreP family PP2C-type Ser/Thr phosphatase n=1 Tax=Paenibacillus gyeongsangnamensis TaxID=3388067 RepID=A0ABT4Q3H7_9BACL|nr:Stp1/IreP family PP2C-type Ser/Thr phosphatase [Paenibacillus filicis]MCZ8511428.1 Stp1/IreP family PP2C-type Ser/Thr phosphatase [Paenibacillus filicis]